MAKTVGFGKLEREMLSNERLPHEVRVARIFFKHQLHNRQPPPRIFENREGVLPAAAVGQTYYEYQVGQATASTPQFPTLRGSHRLVALVDAGGNVLRMYYTQGHYQAGSWWQLQYP
jgi:guanyl-specific ribonuclease Sa